MSWKAFHLLLSTGKQADTGLMQQSSATSSDLLTCACKHPLSRVMRMVWVCVLAESMQIVHGSPPQQATQKQTNDFASVASGMHMPFDRSNVGSRSWQGICCIETP